MAEVHFAVVVDSEYRESSSSELVDYTEAEVDVEESYRKQE